MLQCKALLSNIPACSSATLRVTLFSLSPSWGSPFKIWDSSYLVWLGVFARSQTPEVSSLIRLDWGAESTGNPRVSAPPLSRRTKITDVRCHTWLFVGDSHGNPGSQGSEASILAVDPSPQLCRYSSAKPLVPTVS